MDEQLTTRQVAEALHVSESSVKRWCNCGAIDTIRTVGGHRRIPMQAFLKFLEGSNRRIQGSQSRLQGSEGGDSDKAAQWRGAGEQAPLRAEVKGVANGESQFRPKTAVQGSSGVKKLPSESERQLLAALERGDESACRQILTSFWSAAGSMAGMADQCIATAFRQIGERWDCGKLEVFQERRACEISSRILHEFRKLLPVPGESAPLAIGGAPAGDHYTLPSQLVELVLMEQGWRSMNLGCNLPLSTMVAAVRLHRPRLLWLSVSHLESPSEFAEQYETMRGELPADLLIVVGGRALTDHLRPTLSYTGYCDNLQQLAALACALRGRN